MNFSIFWTDTAQNDLFTLVEYLYQDSLQKAQSIFYTLRERAKSLNQFPQRGRIIPELADMGILNYRELIIERWRLIYKINHDQIFVMALFDSRQNMEDVLFQRLIRR
jgi:addiction module RelE/StbE family toxin